LAWWLGEILRWFARPNTVTYPSISCGGRDRTIETIESQVQRHNQ